MPSEFEFEYVQAQWDEAGVIEAYTFESLPDFYIEKVEAYRKVPNKRSPFKRDPLQTLKV